MFGSWFAVIFCLILATLQGASSLKLYRRNLSPDDRPRAPRMTGLGRQHLFGQAVIGIVAAALIVFCDITPTGLGVVTDTPPVLAFALGIGVYALLLGALELTSKLLGVRSALHDVAFEALRRVWPRERHGKPLAIIAVCVLNPIVEEIIYRGILVSVFGSLIGSVAIAAAISLVLSLLAHSYQGTPALLSQLLFHACAITLLLSPLGLVACIGFHFAGDIVPVATMRAQMGPWAQRRRAQARLRREV